MLSQNDVAGIVVHCIYLGRHSHSTLTRCSMLTGVRILYWPWANLKEAQQLITAELLTFLGHRYKQWPLCPLLIGDAYHSRLKNLKQHSQSEERLKHAKLRHKDGLTVLHNVNHQSLWSAWKLDAHNMARRIRELADSCEAVHGRAQFAVGNCRQEGSSLCHLRM